MASRSTLGRTTATAFPLNRTRRAPWRPSAKAPLPRLQQWLPLLPLPGQPRPAAYAVRGILALMHRQFQRSHQYTGCRVEQEEGWSNPAHPHPRPHWPAHALTHRHGQRGARWAITGSASAPGGAAPPGAGAQCAAALSACADAVGCCPGECALKQPRTQHPQQKRQQQRALPLPRLAAAAAAVEPLRSIAMM
jgi:hypothetical protein